MTARKRAQAPPPPQVDADDCRHFHLATVMFQRARQLKDGARPRVETHGHTLLRVAYLEVMQGTVSWEVGELPVPAAPIPVAVTR